MTANLNTASIKTTNAGAALGTTSRTLGDRWGDVVNVKDFGAAGNGVSDDTAEIQAAIDAALGTDASPNNTSYYLNKPIFFPAGHYMISSPLVLTRGTIGALISGAGRFTTTIENTVGSVFTTNGFSYSKVENMRLRGPGTSAGICFDLNYDGGASTGGRGLFPSQSVTFQNMFFDHAQYGVKLGAGISPGSPGNAQSSETLFLNCFFNDCAYGLQTAGSNACDTSVVGGDFQSCTVGIDVLSGGIENIQGVSFQNTTGTDIVSEVSSDIGENFCISACRTESQNFFTNSGGQNATIICCLQVDAGFGNGTFFSNTGNSFNVIQGSYSTIGQVSVSQGANLSIKDCYFKRSDWLSTSSLWGVGNQGVCSIDLANVGVGNVFEQVASVHIKRQRIWSGFGGTVRTRTYDIETNSITGYEAVMGGSASNVTITIASPGVITTSATHGYQVNDPVAFDTTGALPTGLSTGTTYYVKTIPTTSSFTVSATAGGAAINTSGSQSGTQSLYRVRTYAIGDQVMVYPVTAGGSPGWFCTTAGELFGGGAVFKAIANIAA